MSSPYSPFFRLLNLLPGGWRALCMAAGLAVPLAAVAASARDGTAAPALAASSAGEARPRAALADKADSRAGAPVKRAAATVEPSAGVASAAAWPKGVAASPTVVDGSSLDHLRQRLAETLGARSVESNVVRVTSKVDEKPASKGSAPMPMPASRGVERPSVRRNSAIAAPSVRAAEGLSTNLALVDEVGGARSAASRPSPRPQGPWSYQGDTGPQNWSRLKPEFSACGNGQRQSPIDIRDSFKVTLDPVKVDYRPSPFAVIDNGHTLQVDVAPGNHIEVGGRRYELVKIEFQHPAEERIAGQQFAMGVHLIHRDAQGRQAVMAVLLEPGAEQPAVQSVWNNLPLEKGEMQSAQSPLDLAQLLPGQRDYITYMGSMTQPPCSEGVLWMVMKTPLTASPEQIGLMARLYPSNARPVQPVNGRVIKESN